MNPESVTIYIVNTFILAYLGFSWTWDLPRVSWLKRLASPLSKPFVWIGLWHRWTMFAPNPVRFNDRIAADIYEGDRRVYIWRSCDPQCLTIAQGFLRSRELKLFEHLTNGRFPFMRAVLSENIRRQAESSGVNPTRIVLRRVRASIPLDASCQWRLVSDSIMHIYSVSDNVAATK